VPLPEIDGTVDTVANVQSSVIAHGMRYQPRPVFQDYAAYTPWLAERNRAHYQGTRAPQFVLYRPETIDNRYPTLDQGLSMIELLTRYGPARSDNGLLVLERRGEPMRGVLADGRFGTARFGEWVDVAANAAPVTVWIDVEKNFAGSLAALAWRQPVTTLTVRLADGSERGFRLVDGMARSGFLLSPLIETVNDFSRVAAGASEVEDARRVVAFRVDTAPVGRWFYRDAIRFNYASLVI
jgi:hypothetical protein